jgi:hypothetical protein
VSGIRGSNLAGGCHDATVTVSIRNAGAALAATTVVPVRLELRDGATAKRTHDKSLSGGIPKGEIRSLGFTGLDLTNPPYTSPWKLFARVDPGNAIKEGNENDNALEVPYPPECLTGEVSAGQPRVDNRMITPDGVVTAPSIGACNTLVATVTSLPAGLSRSFDVQLRVSGGAGAESFTSPKRRITTSGSSEVKFTNVPLYSSFRAHAYVDVSNEIAETNETNESPALQGQARQACPGTAPPGTR